MYHPEASFVMILKHILTLCRLSVGWLQGWADNFCAMAFIAVCVQVGATGCRNAIVADPLQTSHVGIRAPQHVC
jgi:hypothetical protein